MPAPEFVPEIPVTVMTYVPAVVPVSVPPPLPGTGPVQPCRPNERATSNKTVARILCHLRLLAGMPRRNAHASAAPPAGNHGVLLLVEACVVPDFVVVMVRVAVPLLELIRLTGVVDPKLKVGGSCATVGPDAIAAVSATLQLQAGFAVTVIVEVLPVVAPAATVTAVPVIVNDTGVEVPPVTVTVAVLLVAL